MSTVGYIGEIWRYPVKSMSGERLDRAIMTSQGVLGDRRWALRDDAGKTYTAKRHPILLQCAAVYGAEPTPGHVPHVAVTLPDGTVVRSDSPEAAQRLSDLIGRRVALHPVQPASNKAFYRRRERGAALAAKLLRFRAGRAIVQWVMTHGRPGRELRELLGRTPDEALPDVSAFPPDVFEFQTPPGTYFDAFPVHLVTTSSLRRLSELNGSASWDVRRFRPNLVIDNGSATHTQAVEDEWVGGTVRIGDVALKGELQTIRCAMPTHPQRGLARDTSVLRTIVRESSQCFGVYASVAEEGGIAVGDTVAVTLPG